MYACELDPLTVAAQQAIQEQPAFNSEYIFYKLIVCALTCPTATVGEFQWPQEIINFVNSVESLGGGATCNLLRGPGDIQTAESAGANYWEKINIPLPSKRTRQRHKPKLITNSGVMTENLRSFQAMASTSTEFINTQSLQITPVCISRDAMAIKPTGDLDSLTNTLVGLTEPVDIQYIKDNPYPDPQTLREKIYTEAGAIIATTLDNHCGLLVANDFLTSKTSGDDVMKAVTDACESLQCCEECLRQV